MRTLNLVVLLALLVISSKIFTGCGAADYCCPEDEIFFGQVDTVFLEREIITDREIIVGPQLGETFDLTVQIGAFKNRDFAENFLANARQRIGSDVRSNFDPDKLYRITVGSFNELEPARRYLQQIRSLGYSDAFLRDRITGIRLED